MSHGSAPRSQTRRRQSTLGTVLQIGGAIGGAIVDSRAKRKREEDERLIAEQEREKNTADRLRQNEALRAAVRGQGPEITPEQFNSVVTQFEPDESKPLGQQVVTKVFKRFADEQTAAKKATDDAVQAKVDRRESAFETGRAPIPPPDPGPPSSASPEGRSFIQPSTAPEPRQSLEQRKLRSEPLPRFAGSPKGRAVSEEIGARGGTPQEQSRGQRAVDVAGATPTSTLRSFIPPKPTAAEKGITTTQQLSRDKDVLAAQEQQAMLDPEERSAHREKATELVARPEGWPDVEDERKAIENQIDRLIKFEFAEKRANLISDAPRSRSESAESDSALEAERASNDTKEDLLRDLKRQLDEIEALIP